MRKSTSHRIIIVDDPISESTLSKSKMVEYRGLVREWWLNRGDKLPPTPYHSGDLYNLHTSKEAFPPHAVEVEALPCRCYIQSGIVHGPVDAYTDAVCLALIGVSTPFWEFSPKDVLFDKDKSHKATVLGNPSFQRGDVFKCGDQLYMISDFEFTVNPRMCRLKLADLPRERNEG